MSQSPNVLIDELSAVLETLTDAESERDENVAIKKMLEAKMKSGADRDGFLGLLIETCEKIDGLENDILKVTQTRNRLMKKLNGTT